MSLGTISSIGLGSNLDLQKMLDDLKGIDKASIKQKENSRDLIQSQAQTIDNLNAQLIGIRGSTRPLSLASSFIDRSASSGKEDVLSATAAPGIALGSHSVEVESLAKKSTWQSKGFDGPSSMVYNHPATGLSKDQKLTDGPMSFSFTFGEDEKAINIDIKNGLNLTEISELINNNANNKNEEGKALVKASVVDGDNGSYIHIEAANPDDKLNQQILLSENSPDFIKPDISFSYQLGVEGTPVYVNIPPGSSYEDLVKNINANGEKHGVQASVINDGSSEKAYRFILSSADTGEANRLFLDGLSMEELQGKEGESLNAHFSVNGISYQRNSNDIDDVILGVKLKLEGEGKSTVSIKSDYEDVKENLLKMMEDIVKFSNELAKHKQREPQGEDEGLLKDLSSIRILQSEFNNLLGEFNKDAQSSIRSLFDLGLSIDAKGIASFDEKKLNEVLENEAEALQKFFIGDEERGLKGFGDIFNDKLTEMTSDLGTLNLEKSNMEEKIKRLDATIQSANERLDKRYNIMAMQFISLDKSIMALNSQADFMTNMFESLNNAASSNKKK